MITLHCRLIQVPAGPRRRHKLYREIWHRIIFLLVNDANNGPEQSRFPCRPVSLVSRPDMSSRETRTINVTLSSIDSRQKRALAAPSLPRRRTLSYGGHALSGSLAGPLKSLIDPGPHIPLIPKSQRLTRTSASPWDLNICSSIHPVHDCSTQRPHS